MCAALEINDRGMRPGRAVAYWLGKNAGKVAWAGFARRESIRYWLTAKGGEYVDVPATRFAERSDKTRRLIWDDMPRGSVVRGIVLPDNDGNLMLKIVTRASTAEELEKYEHDRMPVIEAPMYSAEDTGLGIEAPLPEPPKTKPGKQSPATRPTQGELF